MMLGMYSSPPKDLAGKLQPSFYRCETGPREIDALAVYAREHRCPAIGVFPVFAAHAARQLAGSGISVACKVGHLGMAKPTIKAIEAASAIKDGATEIEVEPLLCNSIAGDANAIKAELHEVVRACRATGKDVLIKAVIRSMLLQREGREVLVETVCTALRQGAVDGVIDIGDDASHAIVRACCDGMFIQRSSPAVDWRSLQRLQHPKLDRMEVYLELMSADSIMEIMA